MPCEAENAQLQIQLAMLRKQTQEVTEGARCLREHCDQQLAERATEMRELQARMAQAQSEAWRLEAALRTQLQREADMKATAEAQADAEARASMERRKEIFGWADMGIRSPNGAMERVEAAERHAAHEAALRQEAERLQETLCTELFLASQELRVLRNALALATRKDHERERLVARDIAVNGSDSTAAVRRAPRASQCTMEERRAGASARSWGGGAAQGAKPYSRLISSPPPPPPARARRRRRRCHPPAQIQHSMTLCGTTRASASTSALHCKRTHTILFSPQ